MNNFLQVAVGGAVGATARYGVTILAGRLTTLPLGTLAVNVTGCFAMGLLAAGLAFRGGQHLAPLLLTGVLRLGLQRAGLARWIWHEALFDCAL